MAEMPQGVKEILKDVEYFKDAYFTYDLPIPYNGVNIYPVTVRNYTEFLSCSVVCSMNKNDDPMGLKMTNLEYLLKKMNDSEHADQALILSLRFSKLIEMCLHVPNCLKCPQCGKTMTYEEYYTKLDEAPDNAAKLQILHCDCGGVLGETLKYRVDEQSKKPILIIDGHEFDNDAFNKLRKYILYQNLPDYKDDSWVDKAIRDDEALKAELISRGQGTASLERKILGVCLNTQYKIDEVYDLSVRKFLQLLGMVDDMINYTTLKQGLMSGMVSLKKGTTVEHWLYKKEGGMYEAAVDAGAYISEIQNAR